MPKHLTLYSLFACLYFLVTPNLALGADQDESSPAITDVGEVVISPRPSALPSNWQQGPFIEIYVRGFQDSNGDGTGDLQGVINQLDYIKQRGFKGIWLMPIFHSQDNNHGYTIRNFRKIEPRFGNEDSMRRLLDAAHQRGIGIILDYVINHSAEKHPLFVAGESPTSPYRDWYVCRTGDQPEGWKAFGDRAWVGDPSRWCYTAFSPHMRDFNLRNPEVVNFHLNNLKYWLNQGVDGFRFDAVGVLIENDADAWENQPENYQLMSQVRKLVQSYPNTFMVCEAPSDPVGFSDSCGHAFAFGLQKGIISSVLSGSIQPELPQYLRDKPLARMATFLSNHDGFAGVRLYNQLEGDLVAYRLAAATYYTLPGIPFTLYGEEIGMSMARKAGAEDSQIRAPMSWNTEDKVTDASGAVFYNFGGFTHLQESWKKKLFRPQADNWQEFNVAIEAQDPNSLLQFYTQLSALRQQHPALAAGSLQMLTASGITADKVLAFIRQSGDEKILVLINYSKSAQKPELQLPKHFRLQSLWPAAANPTNRPKGKQTSFEIGPQQFAVFKLL